MHTREAQERSSRGVSIQCTPVCESRTQLGQQLPMPVAHQWRSCHELHLPPGLLARSFRSPGCAHPPLRESTQPPMPPSLFCTMQPTSPHSAFASHTQFSTTTTPPAHHPTPYGIPGPKKLTPNERHPCDGLCELHTDLPNVGLVCGALHSQHLARSCRAVCWGCVVGVCLCLLVGGLQAQLPPATC